MTIDAQPHPLVAGHAILIDRGTRRAIRASAAGVRYLSVHLRRGPLQIHDARAE